ncbi:MAG: SRPBCC domain-containing protein [Anaerolineales bacterium]
MTSKTPKRRVAGVSDEAVRAKTGKSWSEWIAMLDTAGAADMDHPAIAKYLSNELGVSDWWSQMVTVGYERARGRRRVYETARGFQISRSKTIDVSAARAFKAWSEAGVRRRWLPGRDLKVRKATRNKSIRSTRSADGSAVSVDFAAKGASKVQVVVTHSGLSDPKQAERMKEFWSAALSKLKTLLEGSRPAAR